LLASAVHVYVYATRIGAVAARWRPDGAILGLGLADIHRIEVIERIWQWSTVSARAPVVAACTA
jgi:hypothetical protein